MAPETFDVAVLGLARDCESSLPWTLSFVDRLGQQLRVRLIVGEDGSADRTARLLRDAGAEIVDTTPPSQLSRMARMARARELVRRAYLAGAPADLVLVADLDGSFLADWGEAELRVAETRLRDDRLFGVSATSTPYYDLLAFESADQSFDDLDERIRIAQRRPLSYRRFMMGEVYANQEALASDHDVLCLSAFNGAAFYRHEDYASASYVTASGGAPICEHKVLHRHMAQGDRVMVIEPRLRVPAPREHVRQSASQFYVSAAATLVQRLRRR